MVTAGRPTYHVDMRASAKSVTPDRVQPSDPVVVVATRHLPRPVVWLLWLVGALLGSVVLGFLAGLARPREPDPWPSTPDREPAAEPDPATTTAPSSPAQPGSEDD